MLLKTSYSILTVGREIDIEYKNSLSTQLSNQLERDENSFSLNFKSIEIEKDEEGELMLEFDFNFLEEAIEASDIIIIFCSSITLNFLSILNPRLLKYFDQESEKLILPVLIKKIPWYNLTLISNWAVYPSNNIPLSNLNESGISDTFANLSNKIKDFILKPYENNIQVQSFANIIEEHNVFISYRHTDGDFVDILARNLKQNEINIWMDSNNLEPGDRWMANIDDAIRKSKILLVVVSPEARKSEYVTYEWALALGLGIKVIPILIRETDMHPVLETFHSYNFTIRNSRNWNSLYSQIKNIIEDTNSN